MIDARHETVFPLSKAPKHAERIIGRRLACSTFYRWATRGVKGVTLETRFLGGTQSTSMEAMQRFFDAVTEARGRARGEYRSPAPSSRYDVGERANRELARMLESKPRRGD